MRRTKIIGTIGPASDNIPTIKKLISAGLNIARLNMSHGDHSMHIKRIKALRSADANMTIIFDLQGPKIRIGKLKTGLATIHKGDVFAITTDNILGDEKMVSTSYKGLTKDAKIGDRVLIDDGLIELRVQKVFKSKLQCYVVNGGILKDFKGLNIPGVKISAPSLTIKDRKDLDFAIKQKADYIAISFVRTANDVIAVKKILRNKGADIPVIAKIEKPEAVKNIEDIIRAADAIMVARGDLGVEISPQKVPVIQKLIISRCNYYGKPVIIATQMLESMVVNPRPTRAEASDVANAVFDKADVLMLSEEVAVGKFPVSAVAAMSNIIKEVESQLYTKGHEVSNRLIHKTVASAVAHAACHTAEDINAKAVVAFTSSGSTALLVSKYKSDVETFAVTTKPSTYKRVKLYFGVTPVLSEKFKDTDDMIAKAEKAMISFKALKKGDLVVLVAGVPIGRSGTTNLIKVHKIGEPVRLER